MNTLPLELLDLVCESVTYETLSIISHDILYILNRKRLENYWKKTMVQILIKKRDIRGVKYLIEYHKNVKANFSGYRDSYINQVFLCACKNDNFEMIKYCISKDIDNNQYNIFNIGLYYAVKNNNLHLIKYLILFGADIGDNLNCALESAIQYRYFDIAEYLIFMGAKVQIRINGFICNNFKKLEIIGFQEIINYLIDTKQGYETVQDYIKIWNKCYRIPNKRISYLLSIGINPDEPIYENDPLRMTKFLNLLEG
jgi:hypothetical protein